MTQPIDIDQDTYLRQRPRSMAEELDGVTDPSFADLAPHGIPASAKQHAQRRKAKDQEQRHEHNLQQLQAAQRRQRDQAAQRRQRDQAAHEQVMRKISRGEDIPPQLAEQAMRHQRQQGSGLTTAQLLAARARSGRR